jgi:hypothetical protein
MSEHATGAIGSSSWLAAYVAGMVDADGSIGIGRTFREGREKYTIRVDVTQSEKGRPALDKMREAFGGAVYRQRRPSATQLAQYQWMLNGNVAATTITAIRPHLLVKQAQADLALQAWAVIAAAPVVKRVKWTPELCRQVRGFKERMSELNRMGP